MSQPVLKSQAHIDAFDGVRGFALVLVLLFHTSFAISTKLPVLRIVQRLIWFGWSGVDLFFVLSGLLITGILIDTRGASNYLSSFYARRFLRIFPLYYLVLGVLTCALLLSSQIAAYLPPNLLFQALYVNNMSDVYTPLYRLQVVGHFWSLALEEQFYLIWPFCVLLAIPKQLWKVCLTGILLAILVRCVLFAANGPSDLIYKSLPTRMDSLLIGALCAILMRHTEVLRPWKRYFWLIGLFLIGGTFATALVEHRNRYSSWGSFVQLFGFTLISAGFGLLLLHVYLNRESPGVFERMLRARPLRMIGKYSYGMYVYHLPLMVLLSKLFIGAKMPPDGRISVGALFIGCVFVTTFATAKLSFDFYEERFLRLKKYFQPQHARAAAAGVRSI